MLIKHAQPLLPLSSIPLPPTRCCYKKEEKIIVPLMLIVYKLLCIETMFICSA